MHVQMLFRQLVDMFNMHGPKWLSRFATITSFSVFAYEFVSQSC